jgi:hypothetical protein
MTPQLFDLIGDIHGQADALKRLLLELGYTERNGIWCHTERRVIFVGDFIDRGPKQLETIDIVRKMIRGGTALAIMGNHELNALAWYTADPNRPGEYLRSHSPKHRKQHEAFLNEFEHRPELYAEVIEWFLSLPLWLEIDGLRVVHACWQQSSIDFLSTRLGPSAKLSSDLLGEVTRKGSRLHRHIELLLKGQEIDLPSNVTFPDFDGVKREKMRRKWWDPSAVTFRASAVLRGGEKAEHLPDERLPEEEILSIDDSFPTFFGHYSLCEPLVEGRFVCLDSCAAVGNKLTAYRWDGEKDPQASKLVSVAVQQTTPLT